MQSVLVFIFIYLIYLLTWATICFIGYLISIVMQKIVVMKAIYGLSTAVVYILYFLIGIYCLIIAWNLLFSNFIYFLLFVFFGGAIIGIVMNFITMPFLLISGYFVELLENKFTPEDTKKISKKSNKSEKETITLSVLLLMSYFITLIYNVTIGSINQSYSWIGHILGPVLLIGIFIIISLIVGGLYNMVRHEKFYPKGKKRTIINTLKVYIIITVLFFAFAILNLILGGSVNS